MVSTCSRPQILPSLHIHLQSVKAHPILLTAAFSERMCKVASTVQEKDRIFATREKYDLTLSCTPLFVYLAALQDISHNVIHVTDGHQALQIASSTKPSSELIQYFHE